MAVLSGQTSPRVPLDRCPATPTSYGLARRGAALLCWGLSRRGAMKLDEALRGALGVGGDGREGVRIGRSGGVGLLV